MTAGTRWGQGQVWPGGACGAARPPEWPVGSTSKVMRRWSLMGSSCATAFIVKYLSLKSAQSMQRSLSQRVGSPGDATRRPRVCAATTVSHSVGR
eukprot:8287758-Alexandrium_andersonii.AAC.1